LIRRTIHIWQSLRSTGSQTQAETLLERRA
jgi:hypothetical protein